MKYSNVKYSKREAINYACSSFVTKAYIKFERNGIKTPIPFYMNAKDKLSWYWYDSETKVTINSLENMGYENYIPYGYF